MTIWDDDGTLRLQDDSLAIKYDMVDEFIFNYTAPAGDIERTFVFDGVRTKNKTRYGGLYDTRAVLAKGN